MAMMLDDSALHEKREELKNQLQVGNYAILPDIILDGVGKGIRKLARNTKTPSYWYSSVILFLIVLLIGILCLHFFDGSHPYQGPITVFVIIAIAAGSVSLPVAKTYIDRILNEFRVHTVDTIQSIDDLTDLQNWFALVCNSRYQLICSLIYGLLLLTVIPILLLQTKLGFIGVGPVLALMLPLFQSSMIVYYLILFFVLPVRLSRYEYRLYSNDPSHSNVIGYLSNILTYGLLLFSIFMAITTVSVSYMWRLYSVEFRVFSLSIIWVPIIAIFVINQSSLSKIVKQSKGRKLGELQTRIEKLEAEKDLANKETIEAITALMDYHDRIRDSKDSTLDVQSVLNFISALLLPLIAALIATLSELVGLFN